MFPLRFVKYACVVEVTNVVWQEEADGMLRLGQRVLSTVVPMQSRDVCLCWMHSSWAETHVAAVEVIVNNEGQVKIVRAWLIPQE